MQYNLLHALDEVQQPKRKIKMYAHIYKGRNKQWILILSRSAAITADHVISETAYATKPEAKRAAKDANATPWNY
jgi:hypothetical protein